MAYGKTSLEFLNPRRPSIDGVWLPHLIASPVLNASTAEAMSDLAPFVAAVLRDKVVAEMEQEIAELRRNKQRIQIKSKSSNVVHAEGFLEDARVFGSFLHVTLTTLIPLPVAELRDYNDLLVLMGGICKGALRQSILAIQKDPQGNLLLFVKTDSLYQGNVLFEICGWPRQNWEEAMAAPRFQANDPQVVEDFVLRDMNRFPGATVKFPVVQIAFGNERDAIQDLPEPA